jgi:hypothetical protein
VTRPRLRYNFLRLPPDESCDATSTANDASEPLDFTDLRRLRLEEALPSTAPFFAAVKNLASLLEAIGVAPRERVDLTLPRLLPLESKLELLPLLLARLPILDRLPLALLGRKSGRSASNTEGAILGGRCFVLTVAVVAAPPPLSPPPPTLAPPAAPPAL